MSVSAVLFLLDSGRITCLLIHLVFKCNDNCYPVTKRVVRCVFVVYALQQAMHYSHHVIIMRIAVLAIGVLVGRVRVGWVTLHHHSYHVIIMRVAVLAMGVLVASKANRLMGE